MSYPSVRLDTIARVVIGATPSRSQPEYWGGDNVWVSIAELDGGVIRDSREHITDLGVQKSASKKVAAGSILFSFKLSIGKVAVAGVDLYTNEAIAAISVIDDSAVLPRYLYHALARLNAQVDAHTAVMGAMLNSAKVKALEIPLPPLNEQRRIAELLDEADRLHRIQKEAGRKARGILPALFTEMFGAPSSWASDPSCVALGELVSLSGGKTPSKARDDFWGGEVPWVTPKDMKTDVISGSQDRITETAVREASMSWVPQGAVLVVVRGMILARTVPVALAGTSVTINQDMKALVPRGDLASARFVFAALSAGKPQLRSAVGTSGHGTRKLDTDSLLGFRLPLPTSDQASRVEEAVALAHATGSMQSRAAAQLAGARNALASRLFAECA